MRRLSFVSASLLSAFVASTALAQAPAASPGPRTSQAAAFRRDVPARTNGAMRRSPSYSSGYYGDSRRAGYRNPGGVGRYEEYYPAGDRFQNDVGRNPVPVPTFNGGSGVPTLEEQIAAQSLGVAKYNAIQQSIDRYARPYYGFGFYGGFN